MLADEATEPRCGTQGSELAQGSTATPRPERRETQPHEGLTHEAQEKADADAGEDAEAAGQEKLLTAQRGARTAAADTGSAPLDHRATKVLRLIRQEAPPHPPCFDSRAQWTEYLVASYVAGSQVAWRQDTGKRPGERVVVRKIKSPDYCADCELGGSYQTKMAAEGRCVKRGTTMPQDAIMPPERTGGRNDRPILSRPTRRDDDGAWVYRCHYSGAEVRFGEHIFIGPVAPQTRGAYVCHPVSGPPAFRVSRRDFDETEANCNTCAHLQRVQHEPNRAGLLYGRCSVLEDRRMHPYASRITDDGTFPFHPDDWMGMPCHKPREPN